MPTAVTKAGPYYTSGSISFSSLRSNFRSQQPDGTFASDALPIQASELRRNTNTSNVSPIVPDALENQNISTLSNLKLSQFRNSIKYYYLTQTGTYNNNSSLSSPGYNIGTQSWNSNLNKTIRKYLYINGTIGSSNVSQYAAYLQGEVNNLVVEVSGNIYGAGGSAGTLSNISGGEGGPALYVESTGTEVTVQINSTANVYGGGGGGEKGKVGNNGASGTCSSYTEYTTYATCTSFFSGCPNCNPGDTSLGCITTGTFCSCYLWPMLSRPSRCPFRANKCRQYTSHIVPGAPGGEGGNGGIGQGYNQNRTNGSAGSAGTSGGCPNYGTNGETGETGGNGGDWGMNGGSTNNTGNGGIAGRAVSGSNYILTGTISPATIKGLYQI